MSTSRGRPTPSRTSPSPDDEDGHYDMVKQEADNGMEDTAVLAAAYLPLEYSPSCWVRRGCAPVAGLAGI
jgi:hypothetical protein